jgi:tight adherence protein B
MPMSLTCLGFAAGFFLIFAVNFALNDMMSAHRQQTRQRTAETVRRRRKELVRVSLADQAVYQQAAAGLVEDHQAARSPTQRLNRLLGQAGLLLRPSQVIAAGVGSGLAALLLVGLVWHYWVGALVAAVAAGSLPLLYVLWCRQRRLEQLRKQLPEAFDYMCRSMRSGQTTAQALRSVADEFPPPIADEFGYCYEQQNLGLSPGAALRDLGLRTGLLELKIFVLALTIHRQAGGNVSQLLEKLSKVLRERAKIRGSIRGLTAEGRLQALVLLALAPLLLVVMWFLNRAYASALFEHPSLVLGMGISMLAGAIWIRRIVNFDF